MPQLTAEPVDTESVGVEEADPEDEQVCSFLKSNETEDEDSMMKTIESGSGSDDGSSIGSSKRPAWKRKALFVAFVGVVASAGVVISEIDASESMGDGKAGLTPHHGVFDAPQFEQLLWEQIQPIFGSSVAQMELSGHIKHSIRHLKAMAEKDLPKDQAKALKDAQLTAQNWIDLKETVHGARNPDVQEAGKITLDVLNHNLFSSEEVIAQRLKEALQPQAYKLMELRSKIVPARIDLALGAWAKRHNESHAAWKGLLDSPMALQPVRATHPMSHERVAGFSHVPASVQRRLGGHAPSRSPSPAPSGQLGIGGKAVGILSVIMVAIGEILVHVEMFVPGFAMPSWAWKLILTPVQVVSVLTCSNGANAYCNTIMGAMGLNTLDAVFVLFCKKNLFGQKAAAYCEKELNPSSIKMQKSIADKLSKSLGGSSIFH